MATIRHHTRIAQPADDVWAAVADAGSIARWFPLIETSSADDGMRHCTLHGGVELEEEIVTSDDDLRRFQYRIVGGDMAVDTHLGTIDVLEDGGGSLVVYSTEVSPDEVADTMGPSLAEGLEGLKQHLENRG